MVGKIKEWLANVIEELIVAKKIPSIEKINDTATDALISFNECNDKCDTTCTELKVLRAELEILRDGGVVNVSPAQVIDEWLNGKEEKHG